MKSLPDTPKSALEAFISDLEQEYLPWYQKSVDRHYRIWLPLQLVMLASGFVAAILAALMTDEAFHGLSIGRITLVVLPALGTAASTIIVQAKVYQRYQLRERGRVSIQSLFNEGRLQFAAATGDSEYSAIHKDLEARLNQIEIEQGEGFFSF